MSSAKLGSDRTVTLDKAKADELKSKQAKGDVVTQTSKTEKGTDGSTTTTNITTTRKTTKGKVLILFFLCTYIVQ